MIKLRVKTFSSYKLLDLNDLHKKIYNHLIKTNQGFCYYEGKLITREDCQRYNIN